MAFAFAFWILMLLWLVLDIWGSTVRTPKAIGGTILLFTLLLLIGWQVFGAPLHQ